MGAGMTSPYSLYSEEMATFDEDEVYDQYDAEGFINLIQQYKSKKHQSGGFCNVYF